MVTSSNFDYIREALEQVAEEYVAHFPDCSPEIDANANTCRLVYPGVTTFSDRFLGDVLSVVNRFNLHYVMSFQNGGTKFVFF